jgi:tRNA (guanosine-2'-O-)-methyltransferase
MGNLPDKALTDYLSRYVSAHKRKRIEEVLEKRTKYLTVVLEDIYKPHNASAVIRTCDCFGLQDIHIIEKVNSYAVNPYVTRGAAQWVDIHKYRSDSEDEGSAVDLCFEHLRAKGYRILATSPSAGSIPISELEADQKTALIFGNEHEGVSAEAMEKSDGLVHIPMHGFTESFNISVSVAICLFALQEKLPEEKTKDYYLKEEEKEVLRYKWYRQIVKKSELHIKKFLNERKDTTGL